jgi:hypothetical protein
MHYLLQKPQKQDSQNNFIIWPVTPTIYTTAGNLCRSYRLRAYDAVQLACVLGLHREATTNGESAPTFLCADNNLVSFAINEQVITINPNDYP